MTFWCFYVILKPKGDAFMNIELSFVSNYAYTYPGYIVKPQTHRCHEIVFYCDGCHGKTVIGNTEYEFKPFDIAINRRGAKHSEEHFSHGKLTYIAFKYDNFNMNSGLYHFPTDMMPIVDTILHEITHQPFKYNELISCKLQELLIRIERSTITESTTSKALTFIKNYIDENYPQNIKMQDLAKLSGYSDVHFRYLFSKKFGCSPNEYLIEKRCQQAITLLKGTTQSCSEIARQCGFYDSSQLTKIIKQKYSVTPLTIRKQNTSF